MTETRDAVRAMQDRGMDLAAIQAAGLDAKWKAGAAASSMKSAGFPLLS